tara:strand:+ start:390 stop:1748 length:1359 start_codon:yes stop_codon:yes gene_type:complete
MSYRDIQEELSDILIRKRRIFEKAGKNIGIKKSGPYYVKDLKDLSENQRNELLIVLNDLGLLQEYTLVVREFFKHTATPKHVVIKSKKTSPSTKSNKSSLMENFTHKVEEANYERFAEQFDNLKNDLVNRYCKSSKKTLDSQFEKDFYRNHVWSFDIGLEFDNAGLVAFAAFNRCNSRLAASEVLWKEGIKYAAIKSNSICEEKINKLEMDELASILIKFIDDGNQLADGEAANSNTYKALKEKKEGSVPIEICRTVSDLTEFVSKLEDPSINGLCKYLYNSAERNKTSGIKSVWVDALEEMEGIRGYGLALASNFIKDLMLWWANFEDMDLQQLRSDVIGQTNKPDVHVKRMLCLISQPLLFEALRENDADYENFKENDAEEILRMCDESDNWKNYYYKIVNSLCSKAGIAPLELDRVLYGLMSGNISDYGNEIEIQKPTLSDLETILHPK